MRKIIITISEIDNGWIVGNAFHAVADEPNNYTEEYRETKEQAEALAKKTMEDLVRKIP